MIAKEITIPLTGIEIEGEVFINLWGGGRGSCPMTPTTLPWVYELSRSEVAEYINDGGFGCESIERAKVWVFVVYGGHYRILTYTYHFTKKDIPMNAKRGI